VDAATAARPRLITRPLVLVFLAGLCALTSFYLLLSVVPLYATSVGAGEIGAGATTGALMLTTVIGELASARLVARFGYRSVYAVGLLLLGAPALALVASSGLAAIVAVNLVRGLGFAIAVVTGSALVAVFSPDERRAEGLGLYGVVVGVPSVVALPLGVWLASNVGYPPVFIAAAIAALVAAVVSVGLPGRETDPDPAVGIWAALRAPALARPAVIFGVVAMAAGVVATFLPLALAERTAGFVALALLVQSVGATTARWWAGRHGDRHGSARLLVPAVVTAAAGMVTLYLLPGVVAVLVAMLLFGTGFGIAQNATAALMFDRVPRSGYATVGALWNLAFDGGLGIGAVGFGLVTVHTGYRLAFVSTGVVVALMLVVVWRDHIAARRTPSQVR
jgi:predicted MFS family arabinose efflux permease